MELSQFTDMEINMELIEVTPENSIVPVFEEKRTAAEKKKLMEELAAETAQIEARIAARAGALAKLAALGLSAEEIAAL